MAEAPEKSEEQARLEQYLEVCNQVLEANRNRFPFNRIWEAAEASLAGRSVAFAVVDDEPKASCVVRLCGQHIETADAGDENPPATRLSKQYIDDVVAHPDKYIEDPSLIDWRWLSGKT
ncbi:hypothetical protein [Kordiimonas gwangyangensis]|uniref:hypothetical protein n=1 Tax=Kordiimonas gwangyangensis TaxID=288022 RepID=UPI000362BADF|nr:hypothetical protein [Kordiimonas gwangyangensis]